MANKQRGSARDYLQGAQSKLQELHSLSGSIKEIAHKVESVGDLNPNDVLPDPSYDNIFKNEINALVAKCGEAQECIDSIEKGLNSLLKHVR